MSANIQVVKPYEESQKPTEFLHDAFISYSRNDKVFASRIEKALEGYAPLRTSISLNGGSKSSAMRRISLGLSTSQR
jgi:hypothetical protein